MVDAGFRIVQNYGEKSYFCRFAESRYRAPAFSKLLQKVYTAKKVPHVTTAVTQNALRWQP